MELQVTLTPVYSRGVAYSGGVDINVTWRD